MKHNIFQEKIIQNLDDMEEALEGYEVDEFYVTIEFDKSEGGYKAYFFLTSDGEPLAESEEWGTNKQNLINDIQEVFGEEVDIID